MNQPNSINEVESDFKTPVTFGFLTYLSRSGSTFLSNTLNEYKDICVTLEGELPAELFGIKGYRQPSFKYRKEVRAYLRSIYKVSKLSSWPIKIDDVLEQIPAGEIIDVSGNKMLKYLLQAYKDKVKPSAKVVIYKGNPMMPWYISQVAPNMHNWGVIHLIRDPRSVYSSQKRNIKPYSEDKFASSPIEVAYDWQRGIHEIENSGLQKKITIRFEDLIVSVDNTLSRLQKFLEVGNAKIESNSFKSLIPDEEKSIHSKVGKEPDSERVDSWKDELNKKEVQFIDVYLRKSMDKYGYKFNPEVGSIFIRVFISYEGIKLVAKRKWERIKRFFTGFLHSPSYYIKKVILRLKG